MTTSSDSESAVATAVPSTPILVAQDLEKEFTIVSGWRRRTTKTVHALDHVSFEVNAGETLGIVGESGSGKSTLARVLMGLEKPTGGSAWLSQENLFDASDDSRRRSHRHMQIVFQDPYGSLDPKMSVFQVVSEPWVIHEDVVPRSDWPARVGQLLTMVGLDPAEMNRRPKSFSGGQRQRIGIARALALDPSVLILDEPVASLDVSIQAQIVELLRGLQNDHGLAMIFIAHDLAVVRSLAHHVAVMYLGRIVEIGEADAVYGWPSHPYTKALLSAVPVVDSANAPAPITLKGEIPSAIDRPSGCHFRTRCWKAQTICEQAVPPLAVQPSGQLAACFFPESSPT